MRDYIRLTGVLVAVCVIAALLLGATNAFTVDKIAAQVAKANDEARKLVLPAAQEFVKLEYTNAQYDTIMEVYEAKADGNTVGYAIKVAPKGYAGPVEIIVGIDNNGTVQGIKVGNNSETPGLGKNAETPKFQQQFAQKTWDKEVQVIKNGTPKDNEIVAISGSTITSKAVTLGVNQALAVAKELGSK